MNERFHGRDRKTAVLPIPNGRRHIDSLDGIRGIAVILVLAVHFQTMAVLPQTSGISRQVTHVMSWGWCGVDLFFVLSGFLITSILLDGKNTERRFWTFYIRRILRIFPLYYSVVLLCLATSIFLRHSSSNNALGPSPIGWVAYLLYLQNWWMPFAKLRHMVSLGPFWSLAIEEQFYLIWPLCVWQLPTKALLKICILGILGPFLLRWSLMLHATDALAYVAYMNTLTRMDGLLAGGFCAIVVRDVVLLARVQKWMPIAVVGALSGLALIVLRGHDIWNDQEVLVYGHLLLAIGFGCLVLSAYLLDGGRTPFDRAMRSRGLIVFGKYSYGIYVYQGFVLELTLHFFRYRPWWGHSTPYALTVLLGWIAVPFLIAFVSYHLLEKRFLRLKPPFAASSLNLSGVESALQRRPLQGPIA